MLRHALLEALWSALGFNPAQIAQTMTIGDAPRVTWIYRGDFDAVTIHRALRASGYQEVETERGPVLTHGEAGDVDLRHPIQSVVLSAYNTIAVIDNTCIVAGAFLVDVEATLAVFDGNEATLANNRAVARLLSAVGEELVSAAVLDGAVLSIGSMPDVSASGAWTPVAAEAIPPVAYALFGLTPGSMPSRYEDDDPQLQGDNDDSAPRSAFVIALHLGSMEEAQAAVPVIQARYAEGVSVLNGQPYGDLLGDADVQAAPDSPVVKVRITGDRVGRSWLRAVFGLDLAFVYTE